MIFKKETSLLSIGDFIDIYLKVQKKGAKFVFHKLFNLSYKDKVSSKWDNFDSESDFWIIPEIKEHWNKIISGNPKVSYEEYVAKKYFSGKSDLSLLSVGCGEGSHERNFYEYLNFKECIGVDISHGSITAAKKLAAIEQKDITYKAANFTNLDLLGKKYDIILFDSSLHHFENINQLLKDDIKPLLKKDGILVIFEYCGPNRLQWSKSQLKCGNEILKKLPANYKYFNTNGLIKQKVYRPGFLRVYAVDPSEAPDSENLVAALHATFDVVEERKLGWNIIQPLFKGIAHNFLDKTPETKKWIDFILQEEKNFLNIKGNSSDAIFGVFKAKV
jgi:ubiquinone/menaquinone biosynthesis C-methylase UbiE